MKHLYRSDPKPAITPEGSEGENGTITHGPRTIIKENK